MGYGGSTDWLGIPKPLAGETSSAAEEALRSDIPDWVLEILTKALTDANGDGTLGDGFQVSDDGGLDIEVSAGQGFIGGLVIEAAAPTAKENLTDDQINYVFLKKTATTFEDQSFTVEISLSDSMADAILIAAVTCESGDITLVTNTPTGRAPYIRDNPNPQIINDIPGLKVVAPSGGNYTSPKTAIEAASAGDVVYICAGTYNIATAITLPANNITIMATNRDACILNFTAADDANCINLNGKTGTRILPITIVAPAGKTGHGIYGSGCNDTIIEGVKISGFSGTTGVIIYLDSSLRIRIRYCNLQSGGRFGVEISSCTSGRIEGNLVQCDGVFSNSSICIYGLSADFAFISGNKLISPTANSGRTILLRNSGHTRIRDNDLVLASPYALSAGIEIYAYDSNVTGTIIQGNLIVLAGSAGRGIGLNAEIGYAIDETLIAGNTILSGARGVSIDDVRCTDTLVHGNKVATCTTGVSDAGTNTNQADQD